MTEEVLQQQLKKVGIRLNIKNHSAAALFNFRGDGGVLEQGEYQIALFSWHSSPDPAILENLFSKNYIPKRGQNFARIRNAGLTELLEKGSVLMDPAERIKTYHQVSHILAEELPILPLLRAVKVLAYPASLKNIRPNPTQLGTSWNCHEWAFPEKGKARNQAKSK
jgi:peptide/nickel transport system substrate-binding protein